MRPDKMKLANAMMTPAFLAMALATLALAPAAQGQALVDDMEGGNSIDKFGGTWGFSGDFWDKGDSKILSSVDTSLAFPFFKGAYGGGYPDGTGNAAKLQFRFGTTKPGTPPNTYDNFVNMTAPFAPDDGVINLTGAASISFYAKSDKAMQVEVVLTAANITDYAYYGTMISVGSNWTKYTVKLTTGTGGLTRRPFGVVKPLDLSQAQGMQWEVNKGKNAGITAGTLWIDNLTIEGYTWVPAEPRGSCIVTGCIGAPGSIPKPSVLLADFEGPDPIRNFCGQPWNFSSSFPTDPDARPNTITGGVDSATSTLITAGKGFGDSHGGWLEFGLGDSWYSNEGHLMLPTVSLATLVSVDSNLNATGSTGLYFDYKTTGDVEYLDLQVQTVQVHAGNSYAQAFVKLKGTGGQWKSAQVKWTDFILPNWGPEFREAEKVMDFTGLLGLNWSASSAKRDIKGGFAVDNVYLVGISELPDPPSALARRPAIRIAPAQAGIWNGLIRYGSLNLSINGQVRK